MIVKINEDMKFLYNGIHSANMLDLYCAEVEEYLSEECVSVRTGLTALIPKQYCGLIICRFKPTVERGVLIHNGSVDGPFEGEVKVILSSYNYVKLKKFDPIAKFTIVKTETFNIG